MNNHEIDYKLHGDDMQFVEVELDPQETVIAEAGALMMMEDNIKMETIFGDGSNSRDNSGFMGKIMGAGKRLITGESLFMTTFTNEGNGKRHVYFASPYPGKIIPMDLSTLNGKIICQKDAFLAAAKGVSVGIEFQRKLGTGFFGGEVIQPYKYVQQNTVYAINKHKDVFFLRPLKINLPCKVSINIVC